MQLAALCLTSKASDGKAQWIVPSAAHLFFSGPPASDHRSLSCLLDAAHSATAVLLGHRCYIAAALVTRMLAIFRAVSSHSADVQRLSMQYYHDWNRMPAAPTAPGTRRYRLEHHGLTRGALATFSRGCKSPAAAYFTFPCSSWTHLTCRGNYPIILRTSTPCSRRVHRGTGQIRVSDTVAVRGRGA